MKFLSEKWRELIFTSLKIVLVYFIGSVSFISNAHSEDFPFDTTDNKTSDEIEQGLSKSGGLSESEQSDLSDEASSLGGSIRSDLSLYQFDKKIRKDDYFQNPSTLLLYLDHKFKEDLRFLFKGEFIYDGAIDTSELDPVTHQSQKTYHTQLDEFKVQFSIQKSIFVSLGVQKIKWGSGRFWNPSDFLNNELKNLVEKEDRRAGLHLAKFHLPINESNFYYIAHFDKSNDISKTGHALRYEVPLPHSITSGEFSFSYYKKKDQEAQAALDISLALGPVDFYFEGARSKQESSESYVSGISYEWQYTDKSFMVLNLESFTRKAGASSTAEYGALLLSQHFIPFNVANQYYAVSLYVPQPLNWTHTDLSLMVLRNQVDKGEYYRFGYIWSGYKSLSVSMYYGTRRGATDSEFRFGGITNDYLLSAEYKF